MEDIENQEFVVLVVACAAHLQQHLYDLIELQSLEIKVLKKLYGKQPRPNKPDKLLLAASAKKISRKVLEKSEHIVTVDSFRRWYRELIAKTYTAHRKGRPRIDKELEAIIIKMALENESWGEDSICDRLRELGYELSDRTVSNVLARNGIPPSPEREKSTDWKKFIEAHWSDLVAIDFATFEVPDKKGLCTLRHHAFYAIHVDTREVNLLGATNNLNGNWVENISRKIVDPFDGFFLGKKICLMDRDPNFTKEFKKMLNSIGCKAKVLPAKSPNLNAYIERFIGTARREVGRKIIPFSSKALHIMLKEHLIYYNTERTHQGLEGHCKPLVNKYDIFSGGKGELRKSSRLGNTLNFYYRDAV